jgi:hypothetical protein
MLYRGAKDGSSPCYSLILRLRVRWENGILLYLSNKDCQISLVDAPRARRLSNSPRYTPYSKPESLGGIVLIVKNIRN